MLNHQNLESCQDQDYFLSSRWLETGLEVYITVILCNKVSAACIFIQSNISFYVNLPSSTSIFTAELVSLKLALTNICKT